MLDSVTLKSEEFTTSTLQINPFTSPLVLTQVCRLLEDNPDSSLLLIDLDQIQQKWNFFKSLLPRVTPYYPIRSNPDIEICLQLAKLGCMFDCSTLREIQQIEALGVSTDCIFYSNPVKHPTHLIHSKDLGVNLTIFDSKEELYKIYEFYPETKLLLRVKIDDILFSNFNSYKDKIILLLNLSKELCLSVVGISLQINRDYIYTYEKALYFARSIFGFAEELGLNFYILNLGGEFLGISEQETGNFFDLASSLNNLLEMLFPSVSITAELGKYFFSSCGTLVTKVIGKNEMSELSQQTFSYVLNDGLYGSFHSMITDGVSLPVPYPVKGVYSNSLLFKTTMYGPTCDSLDRVISDCLFPQMEVGDLIYFPNMGGYGSCSKFNGIGILPKVFYVRNNNK